MLKDSHHTKETIQKLKESHKGQISGFKDKCHSEKTRKLMSDNYIYHTNSGCFKKGSIPLNKGKKPSGKTKNKISEANKGKHNSTATEFKVGQIPWNKGFTKETDKRLKKMGIKVSKTQKGIPKPNVSKALKGRKLTKEHIRNALRRRIPSSLEDKFQRIIDKHKLPYKYVGDGSFILGHFNPDFINTNNEKIAVEVYARCFKLWHKKSIDEWKRERSEMFAKYGWEIIYFDEVELTEKNVLNKLEREMIN